MNEWDKVHLNEYSLITFINTTFCAFKQLEKYAKEAGTMCASED